MENPVNQALYECHSLFAAAIKREREKQKKYIKQDIDREADDDS